MPSLQTLWEGAKAWSSETFFSKKPEFTEDQFPNLDGKVWVVSGASGGIGYEVALRLARQKAKVWLIARSQEKLENSMTKIREELPNAHLDYCVVDFADLATFKPGLKRLLESESRLDGIIHNAGVMFPEKGLKTEQAYEYQVGVNNIGPQLLQKFLDPLIVREGEQQTEAPGRIVWVSSLALFMSSYDFENPNDITQSVSERYAFSKAVNYVQCVQWSAHHPSSNVLSVAVHPGVINTDLFRHTDTISNTIVNAMKWPPEYGAYSELYGALSPEIDGSCDNCYVIPFGRKGQVSSELYKRAHDGRGERLWDWLSSQVEAYI